MAWFPISHTVPQYEDGNGDPYSGAVLKVFAAGTTTPIAFATDYTGITTVSSIALNAAGFPSVSGNVVIPFVEKRYKLVLYPTQAAANSDSGAIWTIDNMPISADFGNTTEIITTSTVLDSSDNFTHKEISGTVTIDLPVSGTGLSVFTARNNGTGLVTFDPSGAELINGLSTVILYPGDSGLFQNSLTAWSITGFKAPQAEIDIASATTTNIGLVASDKIRITGTTTITSLGIINAGIVRMVRFSASLTLTHDGTSLILPNAANITTQVGDTAFALSLGSGNWRVFYAAAVVPIAGGGTGASTAATARLALGLLGLGAPTNITTYITGSGNFTILSTNFIAVCAGGGGGGGASNTNAGTAGTSSTFSSLTGSGGTGGNQGGVDGLIHAAHGTASGGDINITGGGGKDGAGAVDYQGSGTNNIGAAGGNGGLAIKLFTAQSVGGTLAYSVGAGGAGGAAGTIAGIAGQNGYVTIVSF